MTRRELRRENEELRAALELRGYRTIDQWEALPQALRDPLAARAFIAEWGDFGRALIRLGPSRYAIRKRSDRYSPRCYKARRRLSFFFCKPGASLARWAREPDLGLIRSHLSVRDAPLYRCMLGNTYRFAPSYIERGLLDRRSRDRLCFFRSWQIPRIARMRTGIPWPTGSGMGDDETECDASGSSNLQTFTERQVLLWRILLTTRFFRRTWRRS